MILYYIRHGDPIYNPDSLTPQGQQQAQALAKRLAMHGVNRVFCSDSVRAQMTAQPTCDLLHLTPTVCPWANEHRPWERMCVIDDKGIRRYCFEDPVMRPLFNSPEMRRLGDDWGQHPAFEGSDIPVCAADIGRDADAFLESLGYRHDTENHVYIPVSPTEERVALFAHQAFGMAFLSHVMDVPYPLYATRFDMGHSGMTVIEFREQDGVVIPWMLQLSNDSHLYREGLPTNYQNRLRF